MANIMYPVGKYTLITGDLDWEADSIGLVLLDETYVYSGSHIDFEDLTGVLGAAAIVGKTASAIGEADGNDVTSISVDYGDVVTQMVIYKYTGAVNAPTTSTLLFFVDTNDDNSPINRPGVGGSVPVIWSNLTGKIFQIA